MEHFVIGTAGHIDHGKTSLIRALTNIECDTHPQERKRGITINLGFAYLENPSGDYLAFVDVPGHHRFISNMVAGATGIDFVMLVIAADDGVMPQTKEHLKICSLLGIKNGIVVINKCDAVGEDEVEFCREEVSDFVRGTFLEDKDIFEVSSLTGKGIDSLKEFLLNTEHSFSYKKKRDFFRLAVDRVFNVSGFGVVATGTVSQGEVKVGDNVTIARNGLTARIRGIQRHSHSVAVSEQGTRVALDLASVKLEDIEFGDILCGVPLPSTNQIDVRIVMMDSEKDDVTKYDAIMLSGTTKLSVKVKIIDRFLDGGNSCALAQIDLSKRWFFAYGDYFILRNSSSEKTIAGGYIIDPLPLNHKNSTLLLKEKLRKISLSEQDYIEAKVIESVELLSVDYFVNSLQRKKEDLLNIISTSENISILTTRFGDTVLINRSKMVQFEENLLTGFKKYIRVNPLSVIGVSRKKLIEFVGDFSFSKLQNINDESITLVLDKLQSDSVLVRDGNQWRLVGARREINESEKGDIRVVENLINEYGYSPFEQSELLYDAKSRGIDEIRFKNIITYLIDLKKIIRIGDLILNNQKLAESRTILVNYLKLHKEEGIKVSDFRDLLGCNRKIAMLILEIFDKEKLVIRREDVRFLIEV